MSRAQRLLELIQILRRHHYPMSGESLAVQTDVSLRTLYRDIETLKAQGAPIEGEAGIGYVLKSGFVLPPLMFTKEELEALILGSRWIVNRADHELADAARNAIAKIEAVLPDSLKSIIEDETMLIGPSEQIELDESYLKTIRGSIREGYKLNLVYSAPQDKISERLVWPIALTFFDQVRVLIAWCEMRQSFRHFRVDRIQQMITTRERYPKRRSVLLKEWRMSQGLHALNRELTADKN